MSLLSRSCVKASVVLTRADIYVYTIIRYIRSLLNNILRPIFKINGPDEARTRVLLSCGIVYHECIQFIQYASAL